jgi:hypothetical protein
MRFIATCDVSFVATTGFGVGTIKTVKDDRQKERVGQKVWFHGKDLPRGTQPALGDTFTGVVTENEQGTNPWRMTQCNEYLEREFKVITGLQGRLQLEWKNGRIVCGWVRCQDKECLDATDGKSVRIAGHLLEGGDWRDDDYVVCTVEESEKGFRATKVERDEPFETPDFSPEILYEGIVQSWDEKRGGILMVGEVEVHVTSTMVNQFLAQQGSDPTMGDTVTCLLEKGRHGGLQVAQWGEGPTMYTEAAEVHAAPIACTTKTFDERRYSIGIIESFSPKGAVFRLERDSVKVTAGADVVGALASKLKVGMFMKLNLSSADGVQVVSAMKMVGKHFHQNRGRKQAAVMHPANYLDDPRANKRSVNSEGALIESEDALDIGEVAQLPVASDAVSTQVDVAPPADAPTLPDIEAVDLNSLSTRPAPKKRKASTKPKTPKGVKAKAAKVEDTTANA